MTDEKLKSFKLGDTHRPGMTAPVKKAGQSVEAEAASHSVGFARIESLLETEDPVTVGEELNELIANLETLRAPARTNRERASAKLAIAAVERAVDLIEHLFQTKAAMEEAEPSS